MHNFIIETERMILRPIGTQILTHILEKNKGRRVYLQTFRDNPARKLYERVGFQKYGETQTHCLMERGRLIS